jgi:hypothetical protein
MMDGFNLDGLIEGTPGNAAAILARRYIMHVERRRTSKGHAIPPKDVRAIEGRIIDAAHACSEKHGDEFMVALSAQYPALYAKAFQRGSPLHQD